MDERIWDKFLTESDLEHLSYVGEVPEIGLGERPALLLIDNYWAVYGEEPLPLLEAIKKWPGAMGERAWEATERIAQLLDYARSSEWLIVHVTMLATSSSGVLPWWDALHHKSEAASPEWEVKALDFHEKVSPVDGEVVLAKSAPSAFFGTPLSSVLVQHRIDSLVVCGESTSGCVRATVQDAASYRYGVTVIEDGVYDRHESAHAINLFDMSQKFADVKTLSEFMDSRDSDECSG